jgi:hypothetical protein
MHRGASANGQHGMAAFLAAATESHAADQLGSLL